MFIHRLFILTLTIPTLSLLLALPAPAATTDEQTLSAGGEHTCGLKTDGTVACWGSNWAGQVTPPSGVFTQISAGLYYTCGIKADGFVVCWGDNGAGQSTPPSSIFTQVSAGVQHTCGLKADGLVACWGDNGSGQATPPSGVFTAVSAGAYHTCGLKPDGSVACWGHNGYGEATPPSSIFTQVNAGDWHTCGLKPDGSVACWGSNDYGQATPPSGVFTTVSSGYGHTCGLQADGTVVCWGNNDLGQATPPSGIFTAVSAGYTHTCGLKADGAVVCWGYNWYGKATPPDGLVLKQPGGAVAAQVALTVTTAGAGAGVVMSNPLGINCASCSANFNSGTNVTLTATPASGSSFMGWSGDCSGMANTCTVSMNAAKNVTATFNITTYLLTVNTTGNGTVSSSPAGINHCSGTCTVSFTGGAQVTLAASAASGSTFAGWSGGGCTGTGNCTVTMNANQSVTALFNTSSGGIQHTVIITKFGTGKGIVLSNPGGISCGDDCFENYSAGTTITLTATPSNGSIFAGWAGNCAGSSNNCTISITEPKAVTAIFNTSYQLSVTKLGNGKGIVTSDPAGLICDNNCSSSSSNYESGATVTLTASTMSGSRFAGWSGACKSKKDTCTVTMTKMQTVTATFTTGYSLTLTTTGSGKGTVTSTSKEINCEPACTEQYSAGTLVTLTAKPTGNSKFAGWSNGCTGKNPKCTVTMTENKIVVATFTALASDFIVTAIKLTPASPERNMPFTVRVTVKNEGTSPGNGGILMVWSDKPNLPKKCRASGGANFTVGNLGASRSKDFLVTNFSDGVPFGLDGKKVLRAFVDSDCETNESDENNNQKTLRYTVR